MSSTSGRGLGRAVGRGSSDSRKGQSSSSAPSVSRSKPPSSVKPSSSQSQVVESRAGFPLSSKEFEQQKTTTTTEAKKGNGSESPAIGRGGIRGRRAIPVAEIVKTKPETCITKQGNFGASVELLSNYFKLETVTDWSLYQYRVDFSVEEERERVLRSWLNQHRDRLSSAYIFDGSMLFTSQVLTTKKPLELTSLQQPDNTPVKITIKLVQQLNYGNIVYLQVFNILVRRCLLSLNLHLVNLNYFDPKSSIHLPQHCLEIWPGYLTSIRQHEHDVLMCADITHKVMRTDTALKFLRECSKDKNCKQIFLQGIVGATVLTDYNNKTYRIDDVDFSVNPLSTFKYRDNEVITYVQYYKRRYQINITDMGQPLLVSRASARDIRGGKDRLCLLVPELCRMTGLSTKMLDNRILMKDLADITRIGPVDRIQRLKEFNNRLQNEPAVAKDFKDWGMTLSRDLVALRGREIPPELIYGGGGVSYSAGIEVDWTKNMRSVPMHLIGKFANFVVIFPNRIRRETEEFLSVLKKAADGMKFHIPRPFLMDIKTDTPLEYLDATEAAISKYNPDLIMYGFLTDRQDRYNAVKRKCYIDRGIPSQVVLARSMKAKGVMSIATKIAVQMNCKIGGSPWTVAIPAEHVMVVGFDVCHDKNKKSNSVGALVASLNKSMSTWFSTVNYHASGEELSNTLSLDLCKAIRKYQEHNKNILPNKIFFYRDGVGEGQLKHVYEHEVAAIKSRLNEIYHGDSYKLAYIIVTKRINTRFFHPSGRNPVPGTIVDDVVTMPEKYDFYLVSQSVRQGTVTPTSYNVISDNLDWPPNYIQRFTYKMTHLYFNCSATVRVPAPCQYAHKLAFMVSQNLHGAPNAKLSTTLYFL